MSGTLLGIGAIEFGHSGAAPSTGLAFASLGVGVIRIEGPDKGNGVAS
jgi:crotonobetainyl-CoA:carnitine CoA-transferase CaiB-like acyl-CoA transferase